MCVYIYIIFNTFINLFPQQHYYIYKVANRPSQAANKDKQGISKNVMFDMTHSL